MVDQANPIRGPEWDEASWPCDGIKIFIADEDWQPYNNDNNKVTLIMGFHLRGPQLKVLHKEGGEG